MKNIVLALLALCVVFSFACGQASAPEPDAVATTAITGPWWHAYTEPLTTSTTPPPIIPPGYYSDVPEAFWPTLDDAYLRTWGSNGFMIADINNDGVPELLLLEQRSEEISLYAIYTLNGDEAVQVDYFGDWRRWGSLAADGTIYVATGARAWAFGWASYRLLPGATQPTRLTSWSMFMHNYHAENSADMDEEELLAMSFYSWDGLGNSQPIAEEVFDAYWNAWEPMEFAFTPFRQ